jgi:hypothetical protein
LTLKLRDVILLSPFDPEVQRYNIIISLDPKVQRHNITISL